MTSPAPAGTNALASRWAPLAAGIVAAIIVWAVWGAVSPPPLFHDERAYMLQARLFAHFHWTAPSPVLPEFFEQAHVLVVPALASKYFPGNSLAMVPGIWLALPALMPLCFTGLTAGLLFALTRRLTNPATAFLAWFIWIGSKDNLTWRTTYFSELLGGACVLVAWWALLHWRRDRRTWRLVLGTSAIALCGITRPLTGIAYAVPFAAVAGWDVVRGHRWRAAAAALAAGLAIAAMVPLWSARTTGSWRLTPLALYSRDYMPYDHPGFGADTTPPRRAVPADLADLNTFYLQLHRRHVPSALPHLARLRLAAIFESAWGPAWWIFLPFALLAFAALPAEGAFAAASAALHFLLYLTYAHPAQWTLYYLELYPILTFLAALGIWRALEAAHQRARSALRGPLHAPISRPASVGIGLLALVLCWPVLNGVASVSRGARESRIFFHAYLGRINAAPARQALVFVRYQPDHNPSVSFIVNTPDPSRAAIVTAYDRGADDVRLMRAMPKRKSFLFDEATGQLIPLAAPGPDGTAMR